MTIAERLAILDAAVIFLESVFPVRWFMRMAGYESHAISTCLNTQLLVETEYTALHGARQLL
jgi:hypothetical protein